MIIMYNTITHTQLLTDVTPKALQNQIGKWKTKGDATLNQSNTPPTTPKKRAPARAKTGVNPPKRPRATKGTGGRKKPKVGVKTAESSGQQVKILNEENDEDSDMERKPKNEKITSIPEKTKGSVKKEEEEEEGEEEEEEGEEEEEEEEE